MKRTVALVALACITAAASAADSKQQVYKWTDVNGVVHFTDTPPPKETPNVQSMHLIGSVQAPTEPAAAPAEAKPADDKTAKPVAATAGSADQRAKDCEQAKRNLQLLQSKYPVSEIGSDGKVKAIDDKDRESRIAGVNDRIAQLCGS